MVDNPGFAEVIVNGQRQYAGLWSALTGITVNDTAGNDAVRIEDTVAGTPVTVNEVTGHQDPVFISPSAGDLGTIQGPVIVRGSSGNDNISFFDFDNAANTTYTLTGSSVVRTGSAAVNYSNITGLFFFGGTGNDTYNILGTLPIPLTIDAGLGSNALNIDDGSNAADTIYTVTASSIARTGSGAVSYSSITNLILTGGSGNNTYNISGTPSGSPATLNTGSGVDAVNVRGASGPLTINSGSGGDTITLSSSTATLGGIGHVILNDPSNTATVTVDDSGFTDSTTYTFTNTQVAAAAWPNFLLSYNNVASLNLNGSSGDDFFEIEGTAGATTTTITAGSGSNHFDLTPTDQYLADIAGPLNLSGSGADTLVFRDTANPNAETYTFDDIPSMLALATVPTFAASWSGMAAVYLETNGLSTVDDPSHMVQVDVPPPPGAPDTAREPPRPSSRAAAGSLVRALLAAEPPRPAALPDVWVADMNDASLSCKPKGHWGIDEGDSLA